MEHAAGCLTLDMYPFWFALGLNMIGGGIIMQYLGPRNQLTMLTFFVRSFTFLFVVGYAYSQNFFAIFDPTEPSYRHDVVKSVIALLVAFVTQWLVGRIFKMTMRAAPIMLGVYAGFGITSEIIILINGFGSLEHKNKDEIGPGLAILLQIVGSLIGGWIGDYSSTSFFTNLIQVIISSYLIVRGSTMFVDLGFPNELVLLGTVNTEDDDLFKMNSHFYLYISAMAVLAVFLLRHHEYNHGKGLL